MRSPAVTYGEPYRNAYQEVPHDPLYASVTKWQGRIDVLEQIPHVMRQAFREATTGTPRPVHIDMAGYTGDAVTAEEGSFDVIADETHIRFPAFRPAPDPVAVQKAVAAIKNSTRPVIVADRGAEICGAGEAVARLAERIQAPVVATLDAKAIMVDDQPLFSGTLGTYGRSCANHVVAEADLVILAGSNTSDQTTANWRIPKEGTAIIHIDLDPVEIGRNYTRVVGIHSDVRAALEALVVAASPAKHDDWLAQSRKHVEAWRKDAEPSRASDSAPTRPERLCKELTECLPQDAILIADTGYAAYLPAHIGVANARDLLLTARTLDAAEALRMGLVSRVVAHERLREEAVAVAESILRTAPEARLHVKRILHERYGHHA